MNFEELIDLAKKEYSLKEFEYAECPHGALGQCFPKKGKIVLNKFLENEMYKVMTVFHELGHIHCYNNGIYPDFHNKDDEDYIDFTEDMIDPFLEMALKGEQYVDQWGAIEMAKYYPEIRFTFPYKNSYVIRQWKEAFRNEIRTQMKKRELIPETV